MSPPATALAIALALAALAACQSRTSPPAAPRDAAPAAAPIDAFIASDLPDLPIDAPPGPATRDVRPATDAFFAQLAGDPAAIWNAAHPDFRSHSAERAFDRTLTLLTAPTGAFEAITDYRAAAGARPGDNVVAGTARFARATVRFELTFRDDGDRGPPRLVFFNLDLPKDLIPAATPAQARALADRAVHALVAGDFDRFRPFLHPTTDADFGRDATSQLRRFTTGLGAVKTIAFVEQKECKGQCVVYEITAARGKARVDLTLTAMYGQWLVREFHLVLE